MIGKRQRIASPDDSIIASDSEVDEFAESDGDDHGADGLGLYQPDDWQGDEDDDDEEEDRDEEDEDDDDEEEDSDDFGEHAKSSSLQMRRLQRGLDKLPLETLAKAQASLGLSRTQQQQQAEAGPSRVTVDGVKAQLAEIRKQKQKEQKRQGERERERHGDRRPGETKEQEAERIRRDSKHAPVAMSTKKQVSRTRPVVAVPKAERRDPRFSTVSAGHVDPLIHSRAYGFLPGMLRAEFDQLKTAVAVAAKAERNAPRAEREARTAERERLEHQLARIRTRVERTEREARERDVLAAAKKAEAQKRKEGKGAWYMKKSEQRDLLLKSKFDALEQRGGKTAVKKAVEKKRKKVASKEKKSRPFAKQPRTDAAV